MLIQSTWETHRGSSVESPSRRRGRSRVGAEAVSGEATESPPTHLGDALFSQAGLNSKLMNRPGVRLDASGASDNKNRT